MKYVEEFRDPELTRKTLAEIRCTVTQPWVIMEICGGQTHAIKRYGIDQLLPNEIELVHGPGCPVCVTPLEQIDKALEIASRPNVKHPSLSLFSDFIIGIDNPTIPLTPQVA